MDTETLQDLTNATLHISEPDIITVTNRESREVLRIAHDGRIFWKGREVETDDQLRSAMLDVRDCLMSWRV